jgi:CRP/FNR family transcriptional regulator, nitrogen oxide reductase regulator
MTASPLFAGLSTSDCIRIGSSASARVFDRHDCLFNQGQPGDKLMLIQYGCVKLTQVSASGNEVILWMSGERESIGFMLGAGEGTCPYTCSAQAMDRVGAIVWDYPRFSVFLEQFPQIRANMNTILFSRLEELQERFREIATERVACRLAMALLRLIKQVGRPHHSGVQVLLSRGELAQLVGTTLFTISRILSKWDDDGIVLARREAVVVCNPLFLKNQAYSE